MKKKQQNSNNLGKEIIKVLSAGVNAQYNYRQIAAKAGIFDKAGRENVKRILQDFIDAHIVIVSGRGKYKINPKYLGKETTGQNFIVGKVEMKTRGNAYIIPQDTDLEDVFVAESNLGNALHGDTVKVLLFPPRKNRKPEGQIVEVTERGKRQLVGTIQVNKGIAYCIPDNPIYRKDILIPNRFLESAKSGDKVVIIIAEWTPNMRNPLGKVLHVLGKPGDNNVEMNSILAEFDFPLSFPGEVEKEAERIDPRISKEEILKRRDFRGVTTFTIDPADAKDFDDAISYERLENGLHRLGIHIADVSFYVKPGSIIDREAYDRATSVYLVDRVIPMLPETLSNNLCSLRPNEDKLCYSAVFDLDDNAKVHHEWFGRTVVHSIRRFNYDEVQQIIETRQGELADIILQADALAKVLRKKRFDNNAINFEKEEVKFRLDETGKPIGVYLKESKDSNHLIEEFMLLANRKVAEKVGKRSQKEAPKTFVYRVHDEPVSDKLETFKTFVKKLGYDIKTGSRKALASSFNHLFEETKDKGEYNMISQLSIRLMARAVYSTDNIGHYGLAFPYYTHFTSPIRRYPDLLVHRLLEMYLHGKPSVNKEEYENYCKHASQMEQKATEAERTSVKYKQAEYLSDKIGQVFDGTVTGVSKWGVFVELNESKCEGLILMRKFDDDFYYIDEENYTLVGLHQGKTFRIGDTIQVRVAEVDLLKKQMNFDLIK